MRHWNEGRSKIPFIAFRCDLVANLESLGLIEPLPIARPPCGQSLSERRERSRRYDGLLISSSYGADISEL